MKAKAPRRYGSAAPEHKIQAALLKLLRSKDWFCKNITGGAFLKGMPDLFITHIEHGPRWVEIKLPKMKGSKWTPAQKKDFPLFVANGSPIWVLTSEEEYDKLFQPMNLWEYMKQ